MVGKILRKEILGAGIILAWLAVYYTLSLGFSPDAAVFPKLTISATALLTVAYIISTLLKAPGAPAPVAPRLGRNEQRRLYRNVSIIFAEILFYVLAIDLIGFYLSSVLFTVLCMLTVHKGRITILGYAGVIVVVTAIYFVFRHFFTVDFAAGRFSILNF